MDSTLQATTDLGGGLRGSEGEECPEHWVTSLAMKAAFPPPRTRAETASSSTAYSTVKDLLRSETYLAQLRQLVEKFRSDSDHNFDKAELFHREALEWKADAERHAARSHALQAKVVGLQAKLAERDATLEQEQAAHRATHEQKRGLNLFRLIATWLIDAHVAGRSDRLAFAEMRDMAKLVSDRIEHGATFYGYRDEPEKKAKLQALLEELLRA